MHSQGGISAIMPLTESIDQAVTVIKQGGIVGFPTETYYGLAVDPFNEAALASLFHLKQRSDRKPILTLVDDAKRLPTLARSVPELFLPLIEQLWPGPLTLLFPARENISSILVADSDNVGIRISSHPVAAKLASLLGIPITATSANISGHPPATTAQDLSKTLGPQLDWVVDGGPTPGGLGSTIVSVDQGALSLVRQGQIPFDFVRKIAE